MGKDLIFFDKKGISLFNSPIEIGLRSLYLLNEIKDGSLDLQRLVYYDYLLLHSSDISNGPKSLHPNIPYRASEILVKREILQQGLSLMRSKQLVDILFKPDGIAYKSSSLTSAFLEYFNSEYSKSLRNLSSWVIDTFTDYGDSALSTFIVNNLDIWGGEFINESLLRNTDGN